MSNARNLARLLPDSSGKVPTTQIGAGSVLQVQTMYNSADSTTTNQFATNSGSFVSITPKFATSKIFVLLTGSFGYTLASAGNFAFSLWRGGVAGTQLNGSGTINEGGTPSQNWFPGAVSAIDSPATTSATTYYAAISTQSGVGGTVYIKAGAVITVMEIAA